MISNFSAETATPLQCSRSGCTDTATVKLNWRNPKIHAADRVKVWLACPEHENYLRMFLEARSFFIDVMPVSQDIETHT